MAWNELHFEVSHDVKLRITSHFGSSDCRFECVVQILERMIELEPALFRGKSGGVWFDDGPPDEAWIREHDLAFCSTKCLGERSSAIPFPCPMTLRWPQVGIADAEALLKELLSSDAPHSDERIFWIGAATHPSRQWLQEMARDYPEIFDVEIMEWDRDAPGGQRSKTRQVSLPEHARYKYLIDCPGWGYSARINWLLATGRPVFIVDRPAVEHWHDLMEPWVHYVPVAANLSDLLAHWQRLEQDPDLYRRIGAEARAFVASHIPPEIQIRSSLDNLKRSGLVEGSIPS